MKQTSNRRSMSIMTASIILASAFIFTNICPRQAHASLRDQAAAARKQLKEFDKLDQMSKLFRAVAGAVRPAVVEVRVTKRIRIRSRQMPDMFDNLFRRHFGEPGRNKKSPSREYLRRGLGSGVIVDAKNGYILTNYHVIASADEVEVVLADKRTFKTEWIRSDSKTDLAVLKIKADDLIDAPLGDSNKMLVGDWVLAIGAPEGLDQSVTAGIISAKGRVTGRRGYENFLQTDAAINRGNSGGPLVNMHGQVVGINTAIISRTGANAGIGFAIPSNMAEGIMDQLIDGGKVTRGYFGVAIQDVTEELAKSFSLDTTDGVLVTMVAKDSPAERAGLKERDFIVSVDGKKTPDANKLRNVVAAFKPGKTVAVKLYRDGKKMKLKVKIAVQPDDMTAVFTGRGSTKSIIEAYGLTVHSLTEELAERAGYKRRVKGVIIIGVEPGSPAAAVGLREKMIITHVQNKTITSIADFKTATAGKKVKKGMRLKIITPTGGAMFVFMTAR